MGKFWASRRQAFLPQAYFKRVVKEKQEAMLFFEQAVASGEIAVDQQVLALSADGSLDYLRAAASTALELWTLRYTGGVGVQVLTDELEPLVVTLESYAQALRAQEPAADMVWPLNFSDRVQYNHAVQTLGILVLCQRTDLIPRFAAVNDAYKGLDAVYEELLAGCLHGRPASNGFYHPEPYQSAVEAIDASTPEEQSQLMKEAVEAWYPANAGMPFHDSHSDTDPEGATAYRGYWCFELAALTVQFDIDDRAYRDHATYPKDLADWAKAFKRRGRG